MNKVDVVNHSGDAIIEFLVSAWLTFRKSNPQSIRQPVGLLCTSPASTSVNFITASLTHSQPASCNIGSERLMERHFKLLWNRYAIIQNKITFKLLKKFRIKRTGENDSMFWDKTSTWYRKFIDKFLKVISLLMMTSSLTLALF